MVEKKPVKSSGPMNKAEATAITQRIRKAVDDLYVWVDEAHKRKAWKPLGYATWEAYVRAEFDMSARHSYRLIDYAEVVRELDAAAGQNVTRGSQISEREAREIKENLPAVAAEVKDRVAAGQEPSKAVAETVKAKRSEKKSKVSKSDTLPKTEPDHSAFHEAAAAALPPEIREHQLAAADRRSKSKTKQSPDERIAELEQEVAAGNAEIEALKDENAKFSDMRVQFEQGGFDKVVAGKDEEIRVLKARLMQESEDKAGWVGKCKTWQKRALDLGWSNDAVIEIDRTDENTEVIHLG